MTPELLTALVVFSFVASITPGPNNTMLLASGANFGMRRSAPHIAGVFLGFFSLLLASGFGLGGLFAAFPWLHQVLQVVGGAYLIYLAWKIANARGLGSAEAGAKPQTFAQAFLFQGVNPKGWTMALSAMTTFMPQGSGPADVLLVAAVSAVVGLPSAISWAAFGLGLRRFLDRPRILRAFNIVMAVLLVASLYPVAVELFAKLH